MLNGVRGVMCVGLMSVWMMWGVQAYAAQGDEVRLVAVDAIPGRAESLVALNSGDVVLLEPVPAQRAARPMTRLVAAGGMYQLDPIIFGNPSWANLKLDHVTQGADGTLWAVGEDSVVYQRPDQGWEMIQLPELSRNSCKDWGKFGVPCQMIVPVGDGRAVTLRPVMQRGQVGTEVYAVEQGELRPLGSVVLPGVALGPVVKDGSGGFWVMLRRTVQTSNFKPMRGYLHYTADGEWKMWSDSGEVVEGTDFVGKTKFLIDPNVRKMADDGQGGFFALGQDRILYHVDGSGDAKRFSASQPTCQYCQPLAIAYDEKIGTLNMVMGEWREGEAGAVDVVGPTRWLEFNGKTGELLSDEQVPTPEVSARDQREFFDKVVISAAQESKWLSAPGMLLHRSRSGWALLSAPEVLERRELEQQAAAVEASRNPVIGNVALLGELGLVGAGVLASVVKVQAVGDDVPPSTASTYLFGGAGLPLWGALAGTYPAMYVVDYLDPEKRGEPGRTLCLSSGLAGVLALNTLGVLVIGESASPYQEDAKGNALTYQPGAVLGAVGGATLGTMTGALLTHLVYRHAKEKPSKLVVGFLMSAVGGSLSSAAYLWLAPSWSKPVDPTMVQDASDPLRQNNALRF